MSGESGKFSSRNRRKTAAQKQALEREVEREVERRMLDLGLEGRSHVKQGELAVARTERARHKEKGMQDQPGTQSTMGEPSRRWGVSHGTEAWGNRGLFGQRLRKD